MNRDVAEARKRAADKRSFKKHYYLFVLVVILLLHIPNTFLRIVSVFVDGHKQVQINVSRLAGTAVPLSYNAP